jgi:hypothetical protein
MIFEISLITYGESLNKYSEIKRHLTQMDKVAVQSIIRERKKKGTRIQDVPSWVV